MSGLRPRPDLLIGLALVSILVSSAVPARADRPETFTFSGAGHTFYGDWRADVTPNKAGWVPGDAVRIDVVLRFSDTHLAGLAAAGIKADKLCVLVTAERTFDADGWMRLPSDERMSTLLTPDGPRHRGRRPGRGHHPLRLPVQVAARPVRRRSRRS